MKSLFLVLCLLFTLPALAQSGDEASVRAAITQMFTGMNKADSVALKPLFAPGARLQTVINKAGSVSVKEDAIEPFVATVGKAKPGALDERLTNMTVHVDGDLATAWTPYAFYYNSQLSHCGANAFTLVRMGGDWKIQNIIDTRRKCREVKKSDGRIEYSFITP